MVQTKFLIALKHFQLSLDHEFNPLELVLILALCNRPPLNFYAHSKHGKILQRVSHYPA